MCLGEAFLTRFENIELEVTKGSLSHLLHKRYKKGWGK